MAAFYDVQEFLADSQRMPSKILFDIPNCGHLEGSADKDLQTNTNLELPFWLAHKLHDEDMIALTLPRPYNNTVRNALAASPESVHLRNLGGGGGSFYAGGTRLLKQIEDEALAKTLEDAFKARLVQIMDQSQHSLADHGGEGAAYEFSQGLDAWEKELFHVGEASAKQMKNWFDTRGKKTS
ncbi:DNA replication protein PSF3 [Sporobolomyces koalae]|uniref:DNA replication protein PSF3 n=1 Tax=Sporobolomyces koalae TaxID=500713 RepID=UPI003175B2C3